MGLQTRLPVPSALSPMACLDVETPSICRGKFKSVLQLCLQQRRSREQLVEQGIMPPLKTPAAFHERIRSLERARTGNFLKHKLCSRPERSELVRMHILQETQAEASLQATQMKLKRARLEEDLNEKIAQRPGPMELVEKNILPVDSTAGEDANGEAESSKMSDVYNFDEDSSDTSSPPHQQSPRSASDSPPESGNDAASSNSPVQNSPKPSSQPSIDLVKVSFASEQQQSHQQVPVAPSVPLGPVLIKQSLAKLPADRSRSKRSKEPKPRVKKLKYHQYIPPDQKQEPSEVPMDSAYARLLQQQQQFLQLQILSQQQHYSYQTVLPVPLKPVSEVQTSCSGGNVASAPVQLRLVQTSHRPDGLPANLDEMKVAELKMELKLRSLPVSGTKTDLIERLKTYRDHSNSRTAAAGCTETVGTTGASQAESIKLTPPVSPIASKVSTMGLEDNNAADSPAKLPPGSPSPPQASLHEEGPTEKDSEKDKRLHEKERQIEELKRKLEQEQRLVEELKMQLEVEKRLQQGDSPPPPPPPLPPVSPPTPIQVKEEHQGSPSCSSSAARRSPALPALVKLEEPADQSQALLPNQFLISSRRMVAQAEAPQPAPVLLPASLLASTVALQLPAKGLKLHTSVGGSASGLVQTSGPAPQKIQTSAALQQQQCSTQCQPLTKTWRMDAAAQNLLNTFPVNGYTAGASSGQAVLKEPATEPPCSSQSPLLVQQPKFEKHVSKCKDPPRYEDAVKQTRSMLTAAQGPTAASQQMDDLFDVLIESGEISPFIRQDPPSLDKPLPVTASVTTLPINTALSRPPALVQVAQLPAAPTSDPPLNGEPRKLKPTEELQSPVTSMEVEFNESTPPSPLSLQQPSVDGMDWLDLTLSVPAEGVHPLDACMPAGVFSSDFLDSHELHLNWE